MTALEPADPVVTGRPSRPGRRMVLGTKAGLWLLLLAAIALMPLFVGQYRLFEIELILLYVGASSGLNISVGYAGEMLLSQATVMGAACDVSAVPGK